MERVFRQVSIAHMSVEVETLNLRPQQIRGNPLPIDHIILQFKVQVICNHFLVEETEADASLVRQHESPKIPFMTHQLPVRIFKDCDGSLQEFLSSKFSRYGDIINVKSITDNIMNKWNMIKDDDEASNSCRLGENLPLIITLKLWNVVLHHHERPSFMNLNVEDTTMVPACSNAMETMLRRVNMEKITSDQRCVICMEGIEKQKDTAMLLVEMPCSHVFHEQCLKTWLETSHYCPICRFDMPTL